MAFFSKKRFHWKEPKAFIRWHDANEREARRWWHPPVAFLISSSLLLAQWYAARFNPQKHPPPFTTALILAIVMGIICAYGLPWISTLCPSYVTLYEDWVVRVRGNGNKRVKYADIEYFAWRNTKGSTTLVMKPRKWKREMMIGVPSEISKSDVHLFLLSRDVMPQPGT